MMEEIRKILSAIEDSAGTRIPVSDGDRIRILQPEEIYMVRIEKEKTIIWCESQSYCCRKRLYELERMLGNGFLRISKSVLVNLNYLDSAEPRFME